MRLKLKQLHALHKVFADEALQQRACNSGSCLRGETFSFQIACTASRPGAGRAAVEATGPLAQHVELRVVGLSPAEYLGEAFDDAVLRCTPGLYPDVLLPDTGSLRLVHGQWRSLWVTVRVPARQKPGDYTITTVWKTRDGDCHSTFQLRVCDAAIPRAELDHTEWFHADCISTYYECEPWSPRHWQLLKAYFANCAAHGQNMLLTPVFTPPLDTAVGGERPTVQLVDISTVNGKYRFNFGRLKKWITLARAAGIQKFEIAHLFTQWGAACAPKIIVDGKKMFGWHVSAHGKKYRDFLKDFLTALTRFFDNQQMREQVYFHVSDEPNEQHLESYARASQFVRPLLEGYTVIDALSDPAFYKNGLVKNPVPANNHIESFTDLGIENLWTYYCTSQWNKVPNRFFHFPSARNRIMGFLMYVYGIKGFLHWGYNFWYTQHSTRAIDPFRVTDAGQAFQSGDAFLVYPGQDGPLDSIRHEVFYDAQQDLRACQALEVRIGRARVLKLLNRGLKRVLSMRSYPLDPQYILNRRRQINTLLERH